MEPDKISWIISSEIDNHDTHPLDTCCPCRRDCACSHPAACRGRLSYLSPTRFSASAFKIAAHFGASLLISEVRNDRWRCEVRYSSLLVHVDVDGELGGRVQLSAGLADRFHSHLIGVASWRARPPLIVAGVPIDPGPTEEGYEEMSEVLGQRGKEFRDCVGVGRSQVEWRSSLDFPTEFVAREARAADLVIVGRDRKFQDPYRSADSGALVLRTGRPVLVVPPSIKSLAGNRVVVAWKDTREARRAVQDALPFLLGAKEVLIVEVTETGSVEESMLRLKDVGKYLSRHGVTALAEWVRPIEGTASGALLRVVEEQSVDLIVSGAYGHSRLGEWIFGGMTQDLLTQSPVCCLLSH